MIPLEENLGAEYPTWILTQAVSGSPGSFLGKDCVRRCPMCGGYNCVKGETRRRLVVYEREKESVVER